MFDARESALMRRFDGALLRLRALGIEFVDDASEAIRRWPQLATPAKPVPPPPPDPATEYWYGDTPPPDPSWQWFEPRREFQRLAASWTPRVPLDGDDDGIVWAGSAGRCLEPLCIEGETIRAFDPRVAAQHGDLVLVHWSVQELIRIAEIWIDHPDLAYEHLTTMAAKLLVAFGGTYLVLCNQGCMPLGASRVMACCRQITRNGRA